MKATEQMIGDCASISFCRQKESLHDLQHALRLCNIDKKLTIKED